MARAWSAEYRTTTLCIDSYENGVPKGRFYNPFMKGGKSFESLTQLLMEMDNALDDMDFPKSYTVTRTFAPPGECGTPTTMAECRAGKVGTFFVRVLFRQNASWQGSVLWLEGRREQSFRSALELIMLLDNALTCENVSDDTA